MKKYSALFVLCCLAFSLGCGGDKETIKTVDEMNSTLDSIVTELDTIRDVSSAKQALQNLKKYEGRETELVNKFKQIAESNNLSTAALMRLQKTQTTVTQLQKRLKELAKDPKIRKQLQPIIDKYANRDFSFGN